MKRIVTFFILITSLSQANASIIEAGFNSDPTGGFTDTDTGIIWLDLDKFSAGSINSMFSQAVNLGVTLATKDQITTLFTNLNGVPAASYFNVMGTKWQQPAQFVWGNYDDGVANSSGGQAFININGVQTIIDNRGAHNAHAFKGAWAIFGTVPEPSTLVLLALGVLGVGLSQRQKAN